MPTNIPHAELIAFLVQTVLISLSGVMAPGPVTAVTLGMGARSRHAGAVVAVGHGIVEFPLMILLCLGVGQVFEVLAVRIGIGIAGGVMLLVMGAGMLRACGKSRDVSPAVSKRGPLLTGVVLSAGNPYFLLWWATVGLALATRAAGLGIFAFILFAAVHWLCDLVWLEALSWTSFKGTRLLGPRSRRIIPAVCGTALLVFAAVFLYRAGADLTGMFGRGG